MTSTAANPTDNLRPTSFVLSVCIHVSVVVMLAFGPQPSSGPARPIYDSVIRPNEHKIIWYRKLPEVTPTKRLSDAAQPQGAIKSPRTMLAMSKQPTSSRQLVLQAAPQIKLEQDIQAPNLIAMVAPPPPPAIKAPKRFVAPPAAPKARADPVGAGRSARKVGAAPTGAVCLRGHALDRFNLA